MTCQATSADWYGISLSIVSLRDIAQVDKVLEQIKTILATWTIIVDIDLRLAIHILMVDIVVVLLIVHHLLQVMVVGHIQLHRFRIGPAKTGLCIVGNPIVVLIPIERGLVVIERRTVIVRCGIVVVGEDFPSWLCDTESTLGNRRDIHSESGSRQYKVRLVDLTNHRHTTLEVDVDVQDMALTYWCHIETWFVALIVFIEIDDGDDLLCRQVVDIRLARYIECADLRRRCAMDHKALLEVTQTIISSFINDDTLRNFICRAFNFSISFIISSTWNGTIILRDCSGSNRLTLTLFIDRISVTTIVVGYGIIDRITFRINHRLVFRILLLWICNSLVQVLRWVSRWFNELKHINVCLFYWAQINVSHRVNLLSCGIWNLTIHERCFHHIVFTRSCHNDGRVVTLLIRDSLIGFAWQPVILTGTLFNRMRCSGLVMIGYRCNIYGFAIFITHELCLVVDRLRTWVHLLCIRTVILCLDAAIFTTEGRINEQVKGIVIEVEIGTFFCCHATPSIKGSIGLSTLKVDTTIFSCTGAIIGIIKIITQEGCCFSLCCTICIIYVFILCNDLGLQFFNICRWQDLTCPDIIGGWEFQETGTYLCHFCNMSTSYRSPLGISVLRLINRCSNG